MENQNKKQIKTLTEIVSGLSEKIDGMSDDTEKLRQSDNPKEVYANFFEQPSQTNPQEKKIVSFKKDYRKINSLENEFYAPESIEDVFTNDIILEQKIQKLRKKLEIINHKITAERNFEDKEALKLLVIERSQIQEKLNALIKEYNEIPIGIKIKNKITYYFKFLGKCLSKINIFDMVDENFESVNQPVWKKNIKKLNNINREIDEILKTNTPYGENEDRYERLSKSLNQALKLRNSINKEI